MEAKCINCGNPLSSENIDGQMVVFCPTCGDHNRRERAMVTYRLPDEPTPSALEPTLIRDSEGDITLIIENDNESRDVATLTADGRLMLHDGIPPGFGLNVDQDGRIRTVNE